MKIIALFLLLLLTLTSHAMKTPDWINQEEFPFESHWLDTPDGKLHYIDEGQGPVIIFLHGTPEWSFSYRHLIKAMRGTHRCVAMDMLGFGLSDKPQDGKYSMQDHAARFELLVNHLGLKDVTLYAGDFGGGIAIHYALSHPGNVRQMVFWNTWCRDLMADKHFAKPAKLLHTGMGRFMYLRMNFSAGFVMPRAYADRKKLSKEIHRHYLTPLNTAANRIGTLSIGQELKNASPWWQGMWERLDSLQQVPKLFVWGTADKFIPTTELDQWKRRLPQSNFVELADAGHWPHEEQPEKVFAALSSFLK
jgi:haloalkane dehalogenase